MSTLKSLEEEYYRLQAKDNKLSENIRALRLSLQYFSSLSIPTDDSNRQSKTQQQYLAGQQQVKDGASHISPYSMGQVALRDWKRYNCRRVRLQIELLEEDREFLAEKCAMMRGKILQMKFRTRAPLCRPTIVRRHNSKERTSKSSNTQESRNPADATCSRSDTVVRYAFPNGQDDAVRECTWSNVIVVDSKTRSSGSESDSRVLQNAHVASKAIIF